MNQQAINKTIRAVALGAAVAVAFAACESTTEPTAQARTPRSVDQLILGTWVPDNGGGQPRYIEFVADGTAAVWAEVRSFTVREDLDFDLTWEINEAAPNDVEIEGFGVWTYDRQHDVLLDRNGQTYRRAPILELIL